MKIGYANVRSINTSYRLIETVLNRQNVQIFGLSEIWHPEIAIVEKIKKSWHWISAERENDRGGGTALMISKNIKIFERKDLTDKDTEAVWCNIYSPEGNFLVGSVYVPPNDELKMRNLIKVIDQVRTQNMPFVIIGDLNAHHEKWFDRSTNKLGRILFEYMQNKDIILMNNEQPTRCNNIIDLTFACPIMSSKIKNWKVQPETFLNTDHNLVSFEVGERTVNITEERYDWKSADWKLYKQECKEKLEEWFVQVTDTTSVDEDYNRLVGIIHETADKCVPKKKICQHSKGWWSNRLTELSNSFKKAKRLFKQRSDPINERRLALILQEFKLEENKAKSEYVNKLVEKLDPKKPEDFWKTLKKVRNSGYKGAVQPILRTDGTIASSDEEICNEMKKRYATETFDVKTHDVVWFNAVEKGVEEIEQNEKQNMESTDTDGYGHENQDIYLSEVVMAISSTDSNSAPSPVENISALLLKRGGEVMARALKVLFQKCWHYGVLPRAFKTDPKIMLPKPDKDDYNTVRSYRPITLESVLGKVFERIVKERLVWKVEVEGGVSIYQNAYRKQKSCTQSLVSVVNSITQSRKEGEHVALVVLDYESCYEKVWRAGLLKKAYDIGINGRLWVYIKNFLDKRIFSLKVNNFSSEWITSTIGIPQGSVISPILCNVYTSDAMESVNSQHADFADDVSLWKGDTEPKEIERVINKDLETISEWCKKWNMSIASEKTDVILFQPQNRNDRFNIQMNGSQIQPVRSKRVLGVTIDENLNFCEHIERKRQSSLSALRAIDMLFESGKGCSQSVYMRLYKTISLPILEYACPVLVTAHDKCVKEFSKVQRHAMLQATGCMKSTSNNMLEILTNTIPIDIHLRLRQAQEVVRIAGKHENDPLYDEFIKFLGKTRTSGKSNTTFELLMSRFCEFKTNLDLENIEKEFRYTKDSIGLCRTPGKLNLEELKNTKETQERNIRDLLDTYQNDTLIFTDGSALGNPGPTGAGAAIFLDGQNSDPIMLKTPVSKASNNFHGELMGIHLALDFIQSISTLELKPIHIFTDCQAALTSVFGADIPSCKIALTLQTREIASKIKYRGYELFAHWIPGHMGIAGNELADKLAKEAAAESKELEEEVSGLLDKREVINQMKGKAKEKWQRQHDLNEETNRTNELFEHVDARDCSFDTDRQNFTIFNQLISGHCKLKAHMSKIDENLSEKCESCGYKEDVEHYLFHCNLYEIERANLEKEIEEALKNEENIGVIDENLILGDREASKNTRSIITKAVLDYIKSTGRFI